METSPSPTLEDEFNTTLRVELARQQLTNQDIAAATGLSVDTVGRRRRGKSSWTLDEIEKIAALLGMTTRNPLEN